MIDGFMSCWSLRKDEARRAAAEIAQVPPRQHIADPEPATAEPALAPEEIAALPKIDELRADSDITGFLRRGVPDALRNAALRKIWMLDPTIRDFAGHARDYAYDWNTPGGAPGHGALRPSDDVAAMVRRVFGEQDAASSSQSADQIARARAGAVRSVDGGSAAAAHQEGACEEGKPRSSS